jgi:beta-ureidopropionase / N-carbamoyl-L-amino-acid hydrolase
VTFSSLWSQLESIGRHSHTGGYRRYAWTPEDSALREWFVGEAEARGLDLTTDRVGNQWAWWGDADAAVATGDPGVVMGSHLDSVPDGGAFDGPLGVVSAFTALDALRNREFNPRRPIGIANFCDEEGSRFGVACAGSQLLTGSMDPDRARSLRDSDGVSMAEAMMSAGHDPGSIGRDQPALGRIGTFVELHVEQGRALINRDRSVGVGSAIWPHGRWRIDLLGEANHAGTTKLSDRQDPTLALAELITMTRTAAEDLGCLATIGKLHVEPNAVNAIPSQITAWMDARANSESTVRDLVSMVDQHCGTKAVEESFSASTDFDTQLASRLVKLLADAPLLDTGAGHDAGVLARAGIPTAMLFVRNPSGISHSPEEHAEVADCLAGVDALADVVAELAG